MDWGLRIWVPLLAPVIFKMLKLSTIHYLALSLVTCHIPPFHTERVDYQPQFCWLLTEKVDTGGGGLVLCHLRHTWQMRTKPVPWFMWVVPTTNPKPSSSTRGDGTKRPLLAERHVRWCERLETKVGRKQFRFPPTRFFVCTSEGEGSSVLSPQSVFSPSPSHPPELFCNAF